MLTLGLVGTPACGKSTVASHLQGLGAEWINADLIAREVLNQPDVVAKLSDSFGRQIVDSDGQIIRTEVAKLVFGDDPEVKARLGFLESVVHPPTRVEITGRLRAASKASVHVAILDVPLLFESGWDKSCDVIWCVDAPLESRETWAAARGWNKSQLLRRERNQMPIAQKRRLSNCFLLNDTSLVNLHENVDSLWGHLVTTMGLGSGLLDSTHCFADR